MYDGGDKQRGEKLDDHAAFSGVPPYCELHGMIFNVLDALAVPKSSLDFVVLDAVVVLE